MSRRKQARPRSCKRSGEEDDDVEGEIEPVLEEEGDEEEEEPVAKRLCVSDGDEQGDIGLKLSHNSDVEGVVNGNRSDSGDTGEFHCDTCGSLFGNLEQFMDHRNFECVPEFEGENQPWTIDNLAVNMGPPESPLSSESLGDSPLSALDCPLSPASENMTPDQVPSGVGVSDVNPYGCQFCEKAFPKLSYLKIHEQVHSDQLPFKCAFCSRLFRHKRSRDRHVKLHTGDKKYKCSQCDSAFARSDHLKSHLKTHENGKPFQCTICNRGYQTPAALTSHIMTHKKERESSPDLQCQHCKDMFTSLAELQSHILIHHGENVPGKSSVQCSYCGDMCPSQEALKLHVDQVHIADQLTNCPICQKSCLNTDDLVHHMASHDLLAVDRIPTDDHDLTGSNTGATPSLTHSLGGQPLVSEMLVCPYCFSSDYDSLEILEIHMQSVHSVKPTEVYTCNYCNAPYQNLYSLHEHMRAVHQNQPCMDIKYPCTHCSRQFSSIENLQQHKKLIHYYERRERSESRDSLYCIMCSMAFQSAGALQEHMAMMHHSSPKSDPKYTDTKPHSSATNKRRSSLLNHGSVGGYHQKRDNDKSFNRRGINMQLNFTSTPDPHKERMPTSSPFQEQITCDHCNATFHDRKNFQAHIKHHLESSAGGQYCCKLCKQQFPTEDQLEKHSSTHYLSMTTEYGCTSCVKFFSKPDELQKHLMDIHAHHLYRCSLCKEIFDSKVNVQVHFAIKHSNECKLYKCTKCDSVFRSEMEWQVHVRVNHLHVAKPYRCLFCKESFSSEMDLQCHLTTHNKPFRCPMCDESFHVEYLLDKHMQNAHGNPTDKSLPPPPQMSPVKIKVERDIDTPSFNDRTPPHPSPRYSPKNLNGPGIWKSSELLHTCNICDMKFEQQTLLQAHKAVDHGLLAKKSSTSSASVSPEQISAMKHEPDHQPIRKLAMPAASMESVAPAVSMASLASITSATMTLQERLQTDTTMPPAVNNHSPVTSKSMSLPVVVISEKLSLACMYCSQTFKSRGDLDKHMKIHQNNGSQKCNICDQVFPTTSILAEHKLTHCKIVQGNNCVLCKIPLKNEDQFYVHTQEHGFQGTFMQCLICRQTLASMVELQMHGKHHFQVKSSFYTCCVCLKTFNSKENLVSKMNSSGRTYYVCKPCYHGEHSEYICSECGASFPTNGELDTHIGTHKKSYQCIKCQESFSSEYEIQLHVATHMMTEGNVHDCKLCSRTFESPAKLQCHLIDHTYRSSEFRCSVCCKIFASSAEIQTHAVEHGPGARRYGCSQCNQKFFFSAELENHAFMHTVGENSLALNTSDLTCTECNKTFTSTVNLNNHRKIHERNENNFKCNICPEAFHSMGALQGHFFSSHSHSELDKQTYRCPECDKEFPCLSNLQGHMRIHRLGKENRKAHLRPHPGGKPFLCPVCGKSFAKKYHIKEHMRVHFAQDSSQMADIQSFLEVDVNSDHASITSEDNSIDLASDMSYTEQDGGQPGGATNNTHISNDVKHHVEAGKEREQSAVY